MSLVARVKIEWETFRESHSGERFVEFHDRIQESGPSWVRPLYLGAAFVAFAIGVVLAFIPGPAVVFFALAAALVATQSHWLAERLDRGEVAIRYWLETHRRRRAR